MSTVFHKMHGLGNDFVLLDLRLQSLSLDADLARALANRHTGVGFDQLLVLKPPSAPDVKADFEVWNADGSRAKHCGNGVRCLGHYLHRRGEVSGPFWLLGPATRVELSIERDGQVRADLGRPRFEPSQVPVTARPRGDWYSLETPMGVQKAGAVSLGNPHACVLCDDLSPARVRTLGPLVSHHAAFPDGCNAGFARIIDRGHVELRVFERGAGPTLACGTGACAAMAILRRAGLVDAKVEIDQEGGTLIVEWPGPESPIVMTGPAAYVFEGTLE